MSGQPSGEVPELGALIRQISPLDGVDGKAPSSLIGNGVMIQTADAFFNTLHISQTFKSKRLDEVPTLRAHAAETSTPAIEAAFEIFEAANILMWHDSEAAREILTDLSVDEDNRFDPEIRLQALLRIAVMDGSGLFPVRDLDEEYPDDDLSHADDQIDFSTDMVEFAMAALQLPVEQRHRVMLFGCWLWCVVSQQGRTLSDRMKATGEATLRPNVLEVRAWLRSLTYEPQVAGPVAAKARLLLAHSLLLESEGANFEKAGASFRSRALEYLRFNIQHPKQMPAGIGAISELLLIHSIALGPEGRGEAVTLIHKALEARKDIFNQVWMLKLTLLEMGIWAAGTEDAESAASFQLQLDDIRPPDLPPWQPPGQ